MSSLWTRNPDTGVYTLKADPRVVVATRCECTYSTCTARWAIYADDGVDAPHYLHGSDSRTLAAAKAEALTRLDEIIALADDPYTYTYTNR